MTWLEEMRAETAKDRAHAAQAHQELRAEVARARQEMLDALKTSELRLIERMHSLEVNLAERIGKVDLRVAEVDVRVANVKSDLMKWSFVFWVGAVAAIALLANVLP